MRAVAVMTLVHVAGLSCGDNLAGPGAHGGDRLRLVDYVYDDGTVERDREQFYDVARDERCMPRRWSDGATYCTPDAGEALLIDATCSMAVGRVPQGGTPPR